MGETYTFVPHIVNCTDKAITSFVLKHECNDRTTYSRKIDIPVGGTHIAKNPIPDSEFSPKWVTEKGEPDYWSFEYSFVLSEAELAGGPLVDKPAVEKGERSHCDLANLPDMTCKIVLYQQEDLAGSWSVIPQGREACHDLSTHFSPYA